MDHTTLIVEAEQAQRREFPCPARVKGSPADLTRFVVWRSGCLENVPAMTVSGLRLIGRCVILHVRGSYATQHPPYYYTGLVTMVTPLTLSLMHVNRYTEADFVAYRERERRFLLASTLHTTSQFYESALGVGDAMRASSSIDFVEEEGRGGSGEDQPSAHVDSSSAHNMDALYVYDHNGVCEIDSARGLASAMVLPREAEVRAEGRRRHGHSSGRKEEKRARRSSHRADSPDASIGAQSKPTREFMADELSNDIITWQHGISVGPLPYVTIQRTSVSSAFLGRDPRSSFYSLFQDPLKEVVDMQYLRMFVRQYLVHTSEGNKERRVPLYTFVMARGACPMVDLRLLKRVAFEELPRLLAAGQHCRGLPKRNAVPRQHSRERVEQSSFRFSLEDEPDIAFTLVPPNAETVTQRERPAPPVQRKTKDTCCDCFAVFTLEYRRPES